MDSSFNNKCNIIAAQLYHIQKMYLENNVYLWGLALKVAKMSWIKGDLKVA